MRETLKPIDQYKNQRKIEKALKLLKIALEDDFFYGSKKRYKLAEKLLQELATSYNVKLKPCIFR